MYNPIKKQCYSMEVSNNDVAEISLYGEIVDKKPIDFWTGKELPGDYISQEEFLEDFEKIVGQKIKAVKFKLHSFGGYVDVSIFIHNKIKELQRNGIDCTCQVDGVAMSGGSLIMCACNKVSVNKSSLIMIHKCWKMIYGEFNSDELRKMAEENDAWDKAQIEIYANKTKLDKSDIESLLAETTYMTGEEAVEKGFADELLDLDSDIKISASRNRRELFVENRTLHIPGNTKVPESIPLATTEKSVDLSYNKNNKEGEKKLMAKNFEELKAENPELAKEVEKNFKAEFEATQRMSVEEAVKSERERIKAIDDISALYDSELIFEAKYGKHPCDAKELCYRAAVKSVKKGTEFMKNLKEDTDQSGVNSVEACFNSEKNSENNSANLRNEIRAEVKSLLKKSENKK